MRRPFLLCDPGFLVPPPKGEEIAAHHQFWQRLFRWSTDRRVRIGEESRRAALEMLGEMGWPDLDPPRCPKALVRDAERVLNGFLSSVALDPPRVPEEIPDLDPEYVFDEGLGLAVAMDISEHHDEWLLGAASDHLHWARPTARIRVSAMESAILSLVTVPHHRLEQERDLEVASELADKRLSIVGGKARQHVYDELEQHFKMRLADVRWIEPEKGHRTHLDHLRGVRPGRDVLVCLTGSIGHVTSQEVAKLGARRGVPVLNIPRDSAIIDRLRARFSSD